MYSIAADSACVLGYRHQRHDRDVSQYLLSPMTLRQPSPYTTSVFKSPSTRMQQLRAFRRNSSLLTLPSSTFVMETKHSVVVHHVHALLDPWSLLETAAQGRNMRRWRNRFEVVCFVTLLSVKLPN